MKYVRIPCIVLAALLALSLVNSAAIDRRCADWLELVEASDAAVVRSAPEPVVVDLTEGAKIVAYAKQYMGTPYVYGATRLHDGQGRLLKNFTDLNFFACSSLYIMKKIRFK